VFFKDKVMNPFIGAGALASVVDEFNSDNFDHTGLGFIGGAYLAQMTTGGRPIEMIYTPTGTPQWGLGWKQAAARNYLRSIPIQSHGSVMAHRGNYLDLDPTYRDSFGRPMLRMTFDFTGNEWKMSAYTTAKGAEIGRAMDGAIAVKATPRTGSWSVVPYQTTHNTGGTITGDKPTNSVINKYLQSWDVSNLFILGAGAFPQQAGYNPTGTLAALAYYSAAAIKDQYLKRPGPLVQS
jgi:gluconate 2-dehydrogenase alpha chain